MLKSYCKKELKVFDFPSVERIIVIGDIHGDVKKMVKLLRGLKIIDKNNEWIAGETVLVQMGDQIDSYRPHPEFDDSKGYSDIKVLAFFDKLRTMAKSVGGNVFSLLGNHEIMNVMGNFDYVAPSGFKEFETYCSKHSGKKFCKEKNGKSMRKKAFRVGGEFARKMACERYGILKIGQNLFSHAGLMRSLAERYSLEEININMREWLLGNYVEREFRSFINDDKSHLWNRYYGDLDTNLMKGDKRCDEANDTMRYMNVGKIIVGHTPQKNGINSTCGSNVWRTDVGFSSSFSLFGKEFGKNEVLEIKNDKEFNILRV